MTISIPLKPKIVVRNVAFNVVEDILHPTIILPPLYMQINPQTLNQTFQKKINRTQTFGANVEEHWGDELDSISCSNSTGGFISEDFGLTTEKRSETLPYFKFQSVLDVYRNNGGIYDSLGRIIKKGQIVLYFNPGTYYGYFENFTYTEDASMPFRFVFDFTFKVEKSYTGV